MKFKFPILLVTPIIFMAGFLMGYDKSHDSVADGEIIGLNHVGLRVADFDQAMDFYQNKLGLPMSYRFNDPDGNPIFAYFQVSKTTFIELLPANQEHPEGIDHFGLETRQIDSVIRDLHAMGITSTTSSTSPYTGVSLAHAEDASGIYFELIQANEGSELRKAMDTW